MDPLRIPAYQACNFRLHHFKGSGFHKGSTRQQFNLKLRPLEAGHLRLFMSVEELAKKRIIPLVDKIDPNYYEE